MDDYAQKRWESNYHWFWPSSILLYPIENIRINEAIDTIYTTTTLQSSKDSAIPANKDLTITVIDNTLSALPDKNIIKLTAQEREKIILELKNIGGLKLDVGKLGLKDLLALYVNTNYFQEHNREIANETFFFNGMDSGQNFSMNSRFDTVNDYKLEYFKRYSIECGKSNGIQNLAILKGYYGRTDFSLFCKCVGNKLDSEKSNYPDLFKDCNISLNIVSDFFHETRNKRNDSVSNYYEVDNSISNLISFLGSNLKNVNLYKLPLANGDKTAEVNKILTLFTKNCDLNKLSIFDIEFYLSSHISLTTPGLLNPHINSLDENSLSFIRKRSERRINAITRIIYQEPPISTDTLTCCLKDKNVMEIHDGNYYKIHYITTGEKNDKIVNINTPFVLNKFANGTFLRLSMEKGHIPADQSDFSFEIYSTKLKKKFSLPVEFYSSTPSSINFAIFFFESLCYFTIVLLLLLVIHRVHLTMLFYSGYFVKFFAWFSVAALIIPIIVSLLYYNSFIEQFKIPQLLKYLVYFFTFGIYSLIMYSYRYNNSKFLYFEKLVKNDTDISNLFGRLFFAKKISTSTKLQNAQ